MVYLDGRHSLFSVYVLRSLGNHQRGHCSIAWRQCFIGYVGCEPGVAFGK